MSKNSFQPRSKLASLSATSLMKSRFQFWTATASGDLLRQSICQRLILCRLSGAKSLVKSDCSSGVRHFFYASKCSTFCLQLQKFTVWSYRWTASNCCTSIIVKLSSKSGSTSGKPPSSRLSSTNQTACAALSACIHIGQVIKVLKQLQRIACALGKYQVPSLSVTGAKLFSSIVLPTRLILINSRIDTVCLCVAESAVLTAIRVNLSTFLQSWPVFGFSWL